MCSREGKWYEILYDVVVTRSERWNHLRRVSSGFDWSGRSVNGGWAAESPVKNSLRLLLHLGWHLNFGCARAPRLSDFIYLCQEVFTLHVVHTLFSSLFYEALTLFLCREIKVYKNVRTKCVARLNRDCTQHNQQEGGGRVAVLHYFPHMGTAPTTPTNEKTLVIWLIIN